jgi:hypothetical protein
MERWSEIEEEAPALTALAGRILDSHRHKDDRHPATRGSPRISGIEADFRDGDLYIGSWS